jgi:hypothetical protein
LIFPSSATTSSRSGHDEPLQGGRISDSFHEKEGSVNTHDAARVAKNSRGIDVWPVVNDALHQVNVRTLRYGVEEITTHNLTACRDFAGQNPRTRRSPLAADRTGYREALAWHQERPGAAHPHRLLCRPVARSERSRRHIGSNRRPCRKSASIVLRLRLRRRAQSLGSGAESSVKRLDFPILGDNFKQIWARRTASSNVASVSHLILVLCYEPPQTLSRMQAGRKIQLSVNAPPISPLPAQGVNHRAFCDVVATLT